MKAILSEECPRCKAPLRLDASIQLGTRANDYGDCHAFCDKCRIGISNSRNPEERTYICRSLADNLAFPRSEPRYLDVMEHALNQRNRRNKIRRARFEKSEDTLTWSIFSYLEERGLLAIAVQALAGIVFSEPADVLYWGYNNRGADSLQPRLVAVLKELGETERSFSEPDLILHAPETGLVFVEVKYTSANSPHLDPNKAQRYLARGAAHLEADCGDMLHYELLRNWTIGCLLASELGLPFVLVNLVRRGNETSIEGDFGRFLRQGGKHQFRRAEWEGLFEALCPVLNQPGHKPYWDYIRTRTIHFRKAFYWPEGETPA